MDSIVVLNASIKQIQAYLCSREVTCEALVGIFTRRIAAYDQKGPSLNAALH